MRIASLFAAAALALTLAATAHAQLPATPQGEAVKAWLDAINSPDPADMMRVDARAAGIRASTGGFDLISVEAASDTQVVLILRDRMFGDYSRNTFIFNPADPAKIANLRGGPAPRPADAPPIERLDDPGLAAFVADAAKKMDYSGVVLIARKGKPFVSHVSGLADREANLANTLDTKFRVGSMNKMMTAVAILQLAQAGKVKLDAPFGTYLKDYPNKEVASTVTLHHLLTHTGGVGDIFGPQFTAKRLELKTLKDYVALYGARATDFPPGEDNRYANYGFILLGRVIEEVSGQAYADYIRDHIFKPAGMTGSGFEPENVAVDKRSKGYMLRGAAFVSNVDTLPWSGTSAGGGYATAADWLAFATALTSNKLLDVAHTKLLTTKKTSTGYAYGFQDDSGPGVRVYGHGGGAPGMNGELFVIGDGEITIVALSNIEGASAISRQLLKRIRVAGAGGKLADLPFSGATPIASQPAREAAFKAADTDNDGKLDREGFRRLLAQLGFADQLASNFAARDVNKDGIVTREEFLPRADQ